MKREITFCDENWEYNWKKTERTYFGRLISFLVVKFLLMFFLMLFWVLIPIYSLKTYLSDIKELMSKTQCSKI